ncbi:MAG: hypothetical protein WCF66_11615, partial [Pseudolabrys sp.]
MRRRRGTEKKVTRRRKPRAINLRKTLTSRSQRHPNYDPRKTTEQLRRELDEALHQQTATSEVLKAIS